MTLRMNRTELAYTVAKANGSLKPLLAEPRIENHPRLTFWRIIENRFPHDRHHEKHHLVVLRREGDVVKLSMAELAELWQVILPWADDKYDYIKLNLSNLRSIKNIPHLHLCVLKEEYK